MKKQLAAPACASGKRRALFQGRHSLRQLPAPCNDAGQFVRTGAASHHKPGIANPNTRGARIAFAD